MDEGAVADRYVVNGRQALAGSTMQFQCSFSCSSGGWPGQLSSMLSEVLTYELPMHIAPYVESAYVFK